MVRHSLISLLVLCVGCSAQTQSPTDLNRRIEQHVRAYFKLPEEVRLQVGERRASEIPQYDTLELTLSAGSGRSQKLTLLISKDNKTLVRFAKMDLTKDPYADVMSKLTLDGRPWRGNQNAKVVLVNFDDFQCPFCSRMHQTLFGEIYKNYSDRVKIVYKDFPLYSIHPWANRAAVDGNCLAAQNNDSYWAFADTMHANGRQIGGNKPVAQQFEAVDNMAREQGEKFHLDLDKLNACLKAQDESAVKTSVREGEQVGVESTPVLFVNGFKIEGAVPVEEIRAAIDRALRETASSAPVQNTAN